MAILPPPTTDAVERWRPVPDWPGYEVSDLGRVRSLDRVVRTSAGDKRYRGRVLRAARGTASPRAMVVLSRPGEQRSHYVATLVLAAFVGPRPSGGYDACHNNGDPTDDSLGNLRWDTHAENMRDVARHGRHNNAGKSNCPQGHPFDEKNTYITKTGSRSCRECTRLAVARYRQRLQEEAAPRDAEGNPLPPEPKRPYRKANPVSSEARLERTRRRNAAKRAAEQAAGGPPPDELEARRKHQREYMRDRRARERAEKIAAVAQSAT